MTRARGSLAFVLICTALGAPALAHAGPPRMGWKIGTLPHPMTLLIALGQSDLGCRRCQAPRLLVPPRIAPASPGATVTGWTQPLGVRLALRW